MQTSCPRMVGVVARNQADREVFYTVLTEESNELSLERVVIPCELKADGFMLKIVAPTALA